MSKLKTLTIKVPATLSAKVARIAKKQGSSRSEVVREALQAYAGNQRLSFSEAAAEFGGSAKGPSDLSTDPRYLEDLGE